MRHFFLKKNSIKEGTAVITGSEARHVGRVLRRGVGDRLDLLDEDGWEYQAVITAKTSQRVEVRLLAKNPPRKPSSVKITLGQAVPKAHKMDYIVQKATELGVSSVIPFYSSRTGPRLTDERLQKKCHRWQKIALEATKQCGRSDVPTVETIVTFEEIINKRYNNVLKIILWEDEKNRRLKDVLQNSKQWKNIILLVGPEGGFTAEEIEGARKRGFISASLGRCILRTETVGLYLLSVLHYELEISPVTSSYDLSEGET
jgi:16S rRNA (uracil1498-N3)-methyltransferase